MDILSLIADYKLRERSRQALVTTANWVATAILIAWVIFCLAVSIITFLAGIFPATTTVA
jgi:hypothetical protein